jgi:hypothetical protein
MAEMDADDMMNALSKLTNLTKRMTSDFGMEAMTEKEEMMFQRLELKPGDFVTKAYEDNKKWPKIGETVRVSNVYNPPMIDQEDLSHGWVTRMDFSILTKPKNNEEGKAFVEYCFDSRYFRKAAKPEDYDLD